METSNIRIICLVQNQTAEETGNESNGLYRTFEKQTNYFISTFLYSERCDNIFFGRDGLPCYLLLSKRGIQQKKLGEITKDDKWEILFIHDSVIPSDYPDFIFDKNTLLLYHQTPHISDHDSIKQITIGEFTHELLKGKKGRHEPHRSGGYNRLFKFTAAWKPQSDNTYGFTPSEYEAAKKDIVDWFGLNSKLNAALEFLHESLGNSEPDKSILTRPDCFSLDELELQEEDIETKGTNSINSIIQLLQSYQITDKDYYSTLRKLRDRLLAKTGVG